jgi:hypothetical protein
LIRKFVPPNVIFCLNYHSTSFFSSFNINKWFSHRSKIFLFVFFVISLSQCGVVFSSSCALFLDFSYCCDVRLIPIERSDSVNYRFNKLFGHQPKS